MIDLPKISKDDKDKLLKKLGINFEQVTKDVDDTRKLLITSSDYETIITNLDIEHDFSNYKRLLEYRLLVGLLYLDLLTSVRIYLKADFRYEELYSTRQVNVIITEGFKQIYHFNGVGRKKTFWANDIKKIIDKDLIGLKSEYDTLTIKIEDYSSKFLNDKSIKEKRDLSVHYDEKPSKVFDMMIKLDISVVYPYMLQFVDILKDMFEFTNKIVFSYNEKTKNESELIKNEFNK